MSTSESPLDIIQNCGLVIGLRSGVPTINDGVITNSNENIYSFRAYLKRIDLGGSSTSNNVSYGSTFSNGSATRAFRYKGYLLSYRYLGNSDQYELPGISLTSEWDKIFSSGTYKNITTTDAPTVQQITSQLAYIKLRGNDTDQILSCDIASIGGSFLGDGIDDIIKENLKGLPILLNAYQVV
jgi:hypothetical protein